MKEAESECDDDELGTGRLYKGDMIVCDVVDEEALEKLLEEIEPEHGYKSIPDKDIPRKKKFAILLEKWNTYGIIIGRVRFQSGEEQYVDLCECEKAL